MTSLLDAGVAIYVSMAVALSVWIALFIYLWRLDAQARELKRRIEQGRHEEQRPAPTATVTRVREVSQEPVEK
jgi:CcmD family protein